jgi:hypothetical protein
MPVAARFQELRDRVVATVDDKFAEPVRLSFMKKGMPDPDCEQIVIEALLRTGAGRDAKNDGSFGRTWRSRVAAGTAELHIDRTRYPDVRLNKGDSVRAISRKGEPVFEVLSSDERNHARLIVELGQK